MKEPVQPWPPSKYEYEKKIERRYIYEFWESLQEDEYDDDEEEKRVPVKDINKVDLAWLLSQLPEGINPSQVKIEFGYNASSMAYEDHYVKFYYEVTTPARKEEYKTAKKKYEQDKAQYDKDMAAYKVAKHQEEIAAAEAKLAKLKGIDPAINYEAKTIEEFGLSVRTTRALTGVGIKTVGELTHKADYDLLDLPRFGETGLREVREKLKSVGLFLWGEDPWKNGEER